LDECPRVSSDAPTLECTPGARYVAGVEFLMCAMQSQQLRELHAMASRSEFDLFDRNPDPALDELTELSAVLCVADYAYTGWMGLQPPVV